MRYMRRLLARVFLAAILGAGLGHLWGWAVYGSNGGLYAETTTTDHHGREILEPRAFIPGVW